MTRSVAGAGDDLICGGAGNDSVIGDPGDDQINGGPGVDTVLYTFGPVTVDLAAGEASGQRGSDTLTGVEAITGTDANDTLVGNAYANTLVGNGGDDVLVGAAGDDHLVGGEGYDSLDGGEGQDSLNGGSEVDSCSGGETVSKCEPIGSLTELIDAADRDGIRAWAIGRTIPVINTEVAALDQTHRDRLPEVLLDSNATGTAWDQILRAMRTTLAIPDLGFYTEIWSYTTIELSGDGFFGGCGHVWLSPSAFSGLSDHDTWTVLMHEVFHSFNCVNGGPGGALNEGAAIWIFKAPVPGDLLLGETWAEATYGTKLWYRDIQGQPDYPLEAAKYPTPKLLYELEWLAAHDPSRLPWNSQERLSSCFTTYWEQLDRNVDFYTIWLPAAKRATDNMLADPNCAPA